MLIVPRERPLLANLNSYYVNVRRLIEHYQGELGSGGVHFRSAASEGILFFDQEEIVGGSFREKERSEEGRKAVDKLFESLEVRSYAIDVFQILSDDLYFWANIHHARPLHQGLSTDFTDLPRLMKKMGNEDLTGYIDVTIGSAGEGGLVFFNGGKIMGGSFTWEDSGVSTSKERLELLIRKADEQGATFSVSKLPLQHTRKKAQTPEGGPFQRRALLAALGDLLGRLEAAAGKRNPGDFKTVLNRKFMEMADRYDFLDPFAAELQYAGGKVTFTGRVPDQELLEAVTASVRSLAEELGLLPGFSDEVASWIQRHGADLSHLSVSP